MQQGQTTQLNEALSADKYIYRNQKRKLNAYAQFIQEGLFSVKEWQAADRTGVQTLVTVKGKELFIKKNRHLQTIQKPLDHHPDIELPEL